MKFTKDVLATPMTQPQVRQYVSLLKSSFPAITHIAISVPLNPNSDYPQGFKANEYEALWISEIQAQGIGVLLRGVFCEAEAIYNFPFNQSGATYYLNKTSVYLDRIKPLINSSAIIGIFPESTNQIYINGISQGFGNIFLGNGTQPAAYLDFFTKLKALSLSKLPNNKVLITNNFTELNSGWAGGIPALIGETVEDDYQISVAAMKANLDTLKAKYNLPIFVQEWADDENLGLNANMADMFKNYPVDVNFWVGWNFGNEGILSGNLGALTLNSKGVALQPFFAGSTPPTDLTPRVVALEADVATLKSQVATINQKLATIKSIL